jgi:predicted nucleotidyltransferase
MPSIESIQESLIPVFGRYNVRKAVLFGSYAKGTANERSDIDIFVDSGLKGLKFFGLLEDVTTALNRPVDLIDASQVESESRVLSEINSTGVLIYGE